MNIANLQKVLDAIKVHGKEHCEDGAWAKVQDVEHEIAFYDAGNVDISAHGTTANLAGHAAIVFRKEHGWSPSSDTLAEWLEVTGNETDDDDDSYLFFAWDGFGKIGKNALEIVRSESYYLGAVYLLEKLIERETTKAI